MTAEHSERAAGYTQCPHCLTIFRVSRAQAAAAGGEVRCGLCAARFDTRSCWHRRLPDDLPRESATGPAAPAGEHSMPLAAAPAAGFMPPAAAPEPAVVPSRHEDGGAVGGDWALPLAAPYAWQWDAELDAGVEQPRRYRWPWAVALAVLVVMLPAQLVWLERDRLALDPRWRPGIAALCDIAGCELAPLRRPNAVRVLRRTLREHPEVSDALLFTASIVNTAGQAQPWPQLGLRLTDMAGQVVGQRWFAKTTYLAAPASADGLMRPGEVVTVRLALRGASRDATNFELSFR